MSINLPPVRDTVSKNGERLVRKTTAAIGIDKHGQPIVRTYVSGTVKLTAAEREYIAWLRARDEGAP